MQTATASEKTKIQKVFLRAPGLTREQARKIQKTINDHFAGKSVDLYAALYPAKQAATKSVTAAQPSTPGPSKRVRVELTYSTEQTSAKGTPTYRSYYSDGTLIAVVRESNSEPGSFRFKILNASTVPFEKVTGFKSFKLADTAALKYLATYLSFKKPKVA
jgi:hypothetical protein